MKSNSIVQSWLHVELKLNGKKLHEALGDMNKSLGTAYTHSRAREWEQNRDRRGNRLPRNVRVYMGRIAVKDILRDAGLSLVLISDYKMNKLVERMC